MIAEPGAPARDRVSGALLAAIVLLAAWLRFWPDGSVVEGRTFERHDEVHYVDLARKFLNGSFEVRYFINPTLYAYLLAGASAVVGAARRVVGLESSFEAFVVRETLCPFVLTITGRALSIAASALSVFVLARIGRRLFSPAVGLVAALLLALDRLSAQRAVLCGNESLVVLLGLLAFDRMAAAAGGGSSRSSRFITGLLLGLAAATKYSAGILVVPCFVALGGGVAPALAGAAAGFALGAPMALLHPSDFLRGFSTQAAFLHEGYRESDALEGERGFGFYLRTFPGSHHGLALALACAAGIVASLALAARRRDRRQLLLLCGSLPLYVYLGTGIFHRDRFLMPAVPFVLLHGAWLVDRVAFAAARLLRSDRRAVASLALGLAAVTAAATPGVMATRRFLQGRYGHPEPMSALLEQVQAALEPGERVAELWFRRTDRLFLDDDPWSSLGLERPAAELLDPARAALRRRGLQPDRSTLPPLVERCPTLAELKRAILDLRVDAIVVVAPSHYAFEPVASERGSRSVDLFRCGYRDELLAWLRSLDDRVVATTPNGLTMAAILELARAPK